MDFKQTQVETIVLNCNPSGDGITLVTQFTVPMHINIDSPQGFIVRQITYTGRDTEGSTMLDQEAPATPVTYPVTATRTYTVSANFVSQPIGSFINGTSISPQTYFPVNGTNINSDMTFTISNRSSAGTPTGVLCLTLQFVK